MAKVLVVDDDASTTALLRLLLEMDGFEVETSRNLSEAMVAATADIATFIVDCNLADGENGFDLLRAIRGGETGAPVDAPVILVSGDPRLEPSALEAGASIFLMKPYAPTHLTETVRHLLEGTN
ncbi:MAG: response regulator [Anaerolineae bacterium]|nr:response regulator [Anaerolineae bacterium]